MRDQSKFWQGIRGKLEPALSNCESTLGLAAPDQRFRDAITDAVCLATAISLVRRKRPATVRSEWKAAAKQSAQTATALERLAAALDETLLAAVRRKFPELPLSEPLATLLDPATREYLRQFSVVAADTAEDVRPDPGGPQQNAAFNTLVWLLAEAFANATGQRAAVSWDAYGNCYSGRFVKLIEVLAPVLAEGIMPPTPQARGKATARALLRMDKTST